MNKYLSKFLLDNNQLIFKKIDQKNNIFKNKFFLNNSISYFLKKKIVLIQDNNYGFNEIIKEKKTILLKLSN